MPPHSPRRTPRFAALSAAVSLAAATFLTLAASPASAAVVPAAPVALPTAIEVLPPYQPQTFCDPVAKAGTKALASLLTHTYAGTAIVSLTRPCDGSTSEHFDGRAIDWGVDHRIDKQRAQGKAFLHWLFAPDANGNSYAMVRRLGVMYVIWNKQIWGSYSQRWEPYSCSGATACHVNHMHISLDWSGAERKTSFWTGVVRAPMAPPLISLRKLHDAHTQTVSLRDQDPTAVYRLVAGGRYRITTSGSYRYDDRARHRADAECSTTDRTTWTTQPADATSPSQLDLLVNGSHHWHATGTVTNGCSAEHTYRRILTVATGTPLTLVINDDTGRWYGDGSLTVTVVRIG